MSDSTDPRPAVQPRFSSFVIMIAGILFVFALINRLDRLLEVLAQDDTLQAVSTADEIAHNLGDATQRVIAVIGGEKEKQGEGKAETSQLDTTQQSIGTSPDRLPSGPSSEYAPQGEETAETASPAETTQPRTVVPLKPGKGSKLTEILAQLEYTPAEKSIGVERTPERMQTVYKAAKPVTSPYASQREKKDDASAGTTRLYTVQQDDTLWKIASRFYGNGSHHTAILAANPGLRADVLPVGKKIKVPDLDKFLAKR